jgi:hypothetical protein
VGGQERLAEGAPVMATVVERGQVTPGDTGGPATKVDSAAATPQVDTGGKD